MEGQLIVQYATPGSASVADGVPIVEGKGSLVLEKVKVNETVEDAVDRLSQRSGAPAVWAAARRRCRPRPFPAQQSVHHTHSENLRCHGPPSHRLPIPPDPPA